MFESARDIDHLVCSDSATLPKANKVNAEHTNDFDVPLLVKFRLRLPDRRTQGNAEAEAGAAI